VVFKNSYDAAMRPQATRSRSSPLLHPHPPLIPRDYLLLWKRWICLGATWRLWVQALPGMAAFNRQRNARFIGQLPAVTEALRNGSEH